MKNILKTKNILLLSCGLMLSVWAKAQAPAELSATPPAQAEVALKEAEKTKTPTPAPFTRKIQYSLSAGSMFSNGFGSATYIQPGVMFPVTRRFSAFGSLSIINQFGGSSFNRFAGDSQSPFYNTLANQQYILNAGGNYAVNERLNLSGSIWHDFSKRNYVPNAPINLFSGSGGNGMQFRAHYKITENLSVSGGFRYSNGQSYNPYHYQGFNPSGF